MSANQFAQALMTADVDEIAGLELTGEEREMLSQTSAESPGDPKFVFAKSAHYKAVNYLRRNQTQLSPEVKSAFGSYVNATFARRYGGAAVESGCIISMSPE